MVDGQLADPIWRFIIHEVHEMSEVACLLTHSLKKEFFWKAAVVHNTHKMILRDGEIPVLWEPIGSSVQRIVSDKDCKV
jgi:hypothetical protein